MAWTLQRWPHFARDLGRDPDAADAIGIEVNVAEIPALVDWPQLLALRELQEPGEPDVIGELIQMFLEDSTARMTRLREAVRVGDAKVVAREAHSLRGSAGLLGAEQLRHDASIVESQANVMGVSELAAPVERLAISLAAVCRTLEAGP